jgi:hypothetical protein
VGRTSDRRTCSAAARHEQPGVIWRVSSESESTVCVDLGHAETDHQPAPYDSSTGQEGGKVLTARHVVAPVVLVFIGLCSVPAEGAAQKRERVILDSDVPGGVHVTVSAANTESRGAGIRLIAESHTALVHCFFWPSTIAEWQDTARSILDNSGIARGEHHSDPVTYQTPQLVGLLGTAVLGVDVGHDGPRYYLHLADEYTVNTAVVGFDKAVVSKVLQALIDAGAAASSMH